MMSFEEAKQVVQAIRDMDHGKYVVLTQTAADDLARRLGESDAVPVLRRRDIRDHLIEMVRTGNIKEELR